MNRNNPDSAAEAKKDRLLIEAFLAGDDGAFDRLVLDYQDRVFRTCRRILGDYHEADDTAQDVFVKVWKNLKKFRFRSSFSTWLFRITVNTCRNKLSSAAFRRRKRTLRLGPRGQEEERGGGLAIGDEKRTPEKELLRKELGERIEKAIEALPENQKTVVVLRDIEGFTYEQISAITGLKEGTVKSKLARARKKLRAKLREISSK